MRKIVGFILFLVVGPGIGDARECPDNPDVLGTSRVLVVDPVEHPRVGTLQYRETLPLNDHEVVVTFDDGPIAPYTTRILDTLASNCVKATFFVVGSMANRSPDLVRRAHEESHTIGTHTEDHPFNIASLPVEQIEREIERGTASARKALGAAPAPFFRFPGLGRSEAAERYLESQGIMIWSADVIPDDWKQISPEQVVDRSLDGLTRKRRGILLLHDIHERTVEALPILLGRLKSAGFHVVHVVPTNPNRPKTATVQTQWILHAEEHTVDPSSPTE